MELDGLGKFLIIMGIVIVLIGLGLVLGGKVGLGRLPGDILIKRGNFTFYFPLISSIIVSIIISIILNFLIRR